MVRVHERGMKLTARTRSNDWADDEFEEADFGNARLTQRLGVLAGKISRAPHCSLPQAPDGATRKAAYRFFGNPKVDVKGVLEPHIGQTLERIRQLPVVLVHCTIETTPHLWLNATHGKNESDRRRARQIAAPHA